MASTGMQRLKDKHAGKKAQAEKISSKIIASMEKGKKENVKKSPVLPILDAPLELKEDERAFFLAIWVKLQDMYGEEADKYRLSAINLAKIYAIGKKLEAEIEKDGGMILQNTSGNLYAHPAMKMLQANQSQILAHLRAMGMAHEKKQAVKKEEEKTFISEFAQFN